MLPNDKHAKFYINGQWVSPVAEAKKALINPANEQVISEITLANAEDVNSAVQAAKAAFPSFSKTSVKERLDLLKELNAKFTERLAEIGQVVNQTMGAPSKLANTAQAYSGLMHFSDIIKILENFQFEERLGTTMLRHEPIGVCALITPWNWPVNQVAAKVAPALAAGCTMVLKPSENTPLDAMILADIMDEIGVPAGVFNLVNGDGPNAGAALVSHPDVDMVSFTGSTRAGKLIGESAARSVKRVALELGGKSASIVLNDADLETAIPASIKGVMVNSGQSCNATARLLVPEATYDAVAALAKATAESISVGAEAKIGPLANAIQFERVRNYIDSAIEQGAELLTGGKEMPDGLEKGYFVCPTVFGKVTPDMTVSKEEIFGPVVTITTYKDEEEAITLANDTEYGLSGAVWSRDIEHAKSVAAQIRTGMVHINGAGLDPAAPFGGYKMSGNGREWGVHGLKEYLEVKSIYGAFPN